MGNPIIVWKRILDRFYNACYDTNQIVGERVKAGETDYD